MGAGREFVPAIACQFFNTGNCIKGVQCRFAHVSNQTTAVLTSHQSPKVCSKVCSFFLQGQCSNGHDCRFLDPRSADPSTTVAPRKVAPIPLTNGADGREAGGAAETRICSYFNQGHYTSGVTCKFLHNTEPAAGGPAGGAAGGAVETRICSFFNQSHCTSGVECKFLHYTPSPLPSDTEAAQRDRLRTWVCANQCDWNHRGGVWSWCQRDLSANIIFRFVVVFVLILTISNRSNST